ncbi:hypothetical protein AURDEDRAFT_155112 [Auricularia subglabra TFB-10046 SS5]|uniref:Uncharacterized protein n=1 Tax=Auricularia subglabra (strain TFB-10046 / SS5) TaxID=717982 RepID=J0CSQ7_AURST|nr:hypothetical protein AURDEDRAFT_155112 [Auricularia subglabra TFB-10046 SS5]
MCLSGANPLAVRGIEVSHPLSPRSAAWSDAFAGHVFARSGERIAKRLSCRTKIRVFVVASLLYYGLPLGAPTQTTFSAWGSEMGAAHNESATPLRSNPTSLASSKTRASMNRFWARSKQGPTAAVKVARFLGSIPKPAGQVGRPKHGGYSLCLQLGWSRTRYLALRKLIRQLIVDFLDPLLPYTQQPAEDIELVCDLACEREKELLRYEDTWPVRDMLKVMLIWFRRKFKLQ